VSIARAQVLSVLYYGVLVISAVAWFHLALTVPLDNSDSYEYIEQALRISHPNVMPAPDGWLRPKTLVVLLSSFNFGFEAVTRKLPSLVDYHAFMTVITLAYVLCWGALISKIWNRTAGRIASLFLMAHELTMHFSFMALADITTGLFWALASLSFCHLWEKNSQKERPRERVALGILTGILGAAASTGKHHFTVAFPALLFFHVLFSKGGKGFTKHFLLPIVVMGLAFWIPHLFWGNLLKGVWGGATVVAIPWIVLACFLLTTPWTRGIGIGITLPLMTSLCVIDATMRLWGTLTSGLVVYIYYVLDLVPKHAAAGSEPSTFYIDSLFQTLGVIYCGASLLALGWGGRNAWKRLWQMEKSERSARLSVLAVSFLLLIITQLGRHKELRFLLPILPALFATIAACAYEVYLLLPLHAKKAWIGLWILALISPIRQTVGDYRFYQTHPIYSMSTFESVWDFFKQRDYPCSAITYRRPYLAPRVMRFPDDISYQRYGFSGLHILFHTGIKWKEDKLLPQISNTKNFSSQLPTNMEAGACYLLQEEPVLPDGTPRSFWGVRVVGTNLTEPLPSTGPDQIHCRKDGSDRHLCVLARHFYSDI
jgi:hypothetical protein